MERKRPLKVRARTAHRKIKPRSRETIVREGDEPYRALYENSIDAILLTAPDGRIFDANPEACRILQRTKDEICQIGRNGVVDVTDPRLGPALKERTRTGRFKGELNLKRKDGTVFPAEITTATFKDREGLEKTSMIFRDVTERKEMEKKLIVLHRHASQLTTANTVDEIVKGTLDAMEFTLGFDNADFWTVRDGSIYVRDSRGKPFKVFELPTSGPGVIVKAARTKSALLIPDTRREPAFLDDPAIGASGEALHMLSELAVPVLVDNEAAAVLNVESTVVNAFTQGDQMLLETLANHVGSALVRLRQADELKRHSEHLEELIEIRTSELARSEEKYHRLADNMPDILFTIDLEGNYTYASPSAEHVTQYPVTRLLSMNMKQLIASQDYPKILERLKARLRGEKSLPPVEFEIIRADGQRIPLEMHTSPIVNDEGVLLGIQGIAADITKRKEMEQRLLRAEHLAAIGETASMVAHDLRNPLQGIAGATYVLKNESLTTEEKNKMLSLIENSVEYADGIVEDLLDYSQAFRLALAEITPKEITRRALRIARIPNRIEIQDLSEEQPTITVDPDRMKRVFVNLIENAVEAMPEGGTLTIGTKQLNEYVEIVFSDTGTGMSKEIAESLFRPLQTTKAKGMGMGLAICKRLIDAHGGNISVESKTGEGTAFTIRLPTKPKVVSPA